MKSGFQKSFARLYRLFDICLHFERIKESILLSNFPFRSHTQRSGSVCPPFHFRPRSPFSPLGQQLIRNFMYFPLNIRPVLNRIIEIDFFFGRL